MSCSIKAPLYYTLCSVDQFDGSIMVLGVFDSLDAVHYRMKRCYVTCGDEYRIEAFTLRTADQEAVSYNEQLQSKREHEKAEREKVEAEVYKAVREAEPVDLS